MWAEPVANQQSLLSLLDLVSADQTYCIRYRLILVPAYPVFQNAKCHPGVARVAHELRCVAEIHSIAMNEGSEAI